MANLGGSTFERQCKFAMCKLNAIGQPKHNTNSRASHSVGVTEKRNEMIRSFASHISNKYGEVQKLNTYFTSEEVKSFLEDRLRTVSPTTAISYARSFSSMLEGLSAKKISVSADKQIFDSFVAKEKEKSITSVEKNHYISDKEGLIKALFDKNQGFGYVANIQSLTGLRVSESISVVSNPLWYIHNNQLIGIKGKGGQLYPNKDIGSQLYKILNKVGNGVKVSYSSYAKALQKEGYKSHDFRFTYVREKMTEKLEQGIPYKKALKEISLEINHHRKSITEYYLSKSGF